VSAAKKLQDLRVQAARLHERGKSQCERIQALEVELGQQLSVAEIQAQLAQLERQELELSDRAKELTDAAETLLT